MRDDCYSSLAYATPWMVVLFTNTTGNNGTGQVLGSHFVKPDLKVLWRLSNLVNFGKLLFLELCLSTK